MSCWISVFAGNDSRRLQNIYKWKCYGIIYGRNCSLNFRRKKWCRIRQNCSQLNTVISVIEAMYLCEGMWLFPFCAEDRFFNQPSCIYARAKPRRAKYTHRTKLRFVLCVFRPCRGLSRRIRRWVRKRTPICPLTLALEAKERVAGADCCIG